MKFEIKGIGNLVTLEQLRSGMCISCDRATINYMKISCHNNGGSLGTHKADDDICKKFKLNSIYKLNGKDLENQIKKCVDRYNKYSYWFVLSAILNRLGIRPDFSKEAGTLVPEKTIDFINKLRANPDHYEMMAEYNIIGPMIASIIEDEENENMTEMATNLYFTYLKPMTELIQNNASEDEVLKLYMHMVISLKRSLHINVDTPAMDDFSERNLSFDNEEEENKKSR